MTRKVTATGDSLAAFEILECNSTVRDANWEIRAAAPREDDVKSHENWKSEVSAHGELKLTNKLDDGSIIFEVTRMVIRPKGYGKPLKKKSKKRSRASFEEGDEKANWEGWVFRDDMSINVEGEMGVWENWAFELHSHSSVVRAKRIRRDSMVRTRGLVGTAGCSNPTELGEDLPPFSIRDLECSAGALFCGLDFPCQLYVWQTWKTGTIYCSALSVFDFERHFCI